jgi:hypothetical protein
VKVWCRLLVITGALSPVLVSTRPADPVVSAIWRTDDIVVNGSAAEWTGLTRVGDGPMVAVQNDGQTLFLVVTSGDPNVRRQLATGLVVWLDGSAKKAQTFGVRLEGLTRRSLPGETPDTRADLPKGTAFRTLDAFDLLGPEKNRRRLIDQPAEVGITVASGVEDESVVYELKLPLEKSGTTPFAVGARPATTIAMGLETPADPKPPRGRDEPMPINPWLIDPYYGGFFNPPPPTNSADRAPKPAVLKPMKLTWVSVKLAPAPR